MLQSKIHRRYDKDFCVSTSLQLTCSNLSWSDLTLTPSEVETVRSYKETGSWGVDDNDHGGKTAYVHKSEKGHKELVQKKQLKREKKQREHESRVDRARRKEARRAAAMAAAALVGLAAVAVGLRMLVGGRKGGAAKTPR